MSLTTKKYWLDKKRLVKLKQLVLDAKAETSEFHQQWPVDREVEELYNARKYSDLAILQKIALGGRVHEDLNHMITIYLKSGCDTEAIVKALLAKRATHASGPMLSKCFHVGDPSGLEIPFGVIFRTQKFRYDVVFRTQIRYGFKDIHVGPTNELLLTSCNKSYVDKFILTDDSGKYIESIKVNTINEVRPRLLLIRLKNMIGQRAYDSCTRLKNMPNGIKLDENSNVIQIASSKRTWASAFETNHTTSCGMIDLITDEQENELIDLVTDDEN